ncbi:MAG TPA: beta-glucosidase BglX [Pseudomonadales bacterium]|nr:beta-glucosidase BglX [Pseudomonadales bacterium]
MKIFAILTGGLFAVAAAGADPASIYHQGWIDLNKNGKMDVYENPTQPIEKRVNDLLKRMTVDEKIGQLWQATLEDNVDVTMAQTIRNGGIGSFLDGSIRIETPILRNKVQHIAIEQSRLGIPLILGHDAIHGFRTVFPIPLAQACSWEPGLFERTQTIAAREASAAGIDWTFSPMVDLARDPRWGRIAEGFGEDPYLGSLYAVSNVKGFQGENVADPDRVVACVKHYVGYGAAEGGRDYNTTEISPFTLRNFYLPQFKAAIDAGALTVMSAFNDLDGIPASGNPFTLTEVLRNEWNFKGFVVSDYDSVSQLIDHGLAANDAEAARIALNAGVDMEMMSTTYVETVKAQIEEKKISKETLDNAVRRVLMVKFAKGLFDRPYTDESLYKTAYLHPDAVALAREAAAKSCVLLKNDNNLLPLSKHVKIALIGPLGSDGEELVGPWYSRAHADECVSLATGMQQKLSYGGELNVSRGCAILEIGRGRTHLNDYSPISENPTGSNEIAEAVAAATNADVVVMALGEPRDWSGEDGSRSSLDLPGRQQELLNAIAATGKPIVVVLFNGRPLALPNVFSNATAVLEAWFPGVQGGNGVADLLFGDVNPSGRLTTTFPYSVGQVPFYYNHDNTGRPGFGHWHGNYVDGPTVPFLPFGYGLAYTTFQFGDVQLDSQTLTTNGTLTASIDVSNTGKRPSIAVPQLYIRDLAFAGGTRPVRELKGFKRVLLQPGQKETVSFTLAANDLGFYDAQGHWIVQPGKFQLWICQDSASGTPAAFEVQP